MDIDPRITPLLVVDVQNGFVNENSARAVPFVVALVDAWEEAGGPVFLTRFFNTPDSMWQRLIHWRRLVEPPETDLIAELQHVNGQVLDKFSYTSFTPELEAEFSSHGWESVVICGIASDGCVLKSAVDAFERSVIPIVVTDATSSHAGEEVHAAGLLLIGRFIGQGQLVTTSEVMASLSDRPKPS